jgi:hypothetical protein
MAMCERFLPKTPRLDVLVDSDVMYHVQAVATLRLVSDAAIKSENAVDLEIREPC